MGNLPTELYIEISNLPDAHAWMHVFNFATMSHLKISSVIFHIHQKH